jgi:hypothetical protein
MAQAKDPAATEHFGDFTKMLEQFKLPGIDTAAFIEARRSGIVALTQANNVVYEGMQELLRKQAEICMRRSKIVGVGREIRQRR